MVVSRGKNVDAATLPGFIAECSGRITGLMTLHFHHGECEVVTLDAFQSGQGIGTTLLTKGVEEARRKGSRRLWLITTNDNIDALAFYQKRGLRLVAVHPDAVTQARILKPRIPLVAPNGIPIRDEIELEFVFEEK
jgi:ribosomal protein S18 acetylase RimI-like enzyme